MFNKKFRLFFKKLSLLFLLSLGVATLTWGDSNDWIQWTHWVASPQGQVWLASSQGQDWLKQQTWLKTADVKQMPIDAQTDFQWLKDQYLKFEAGQFDPNSTIWPTLSCVGYFNAAYRQEALNRISQAASTQGDIVLFMGDSLTQGWTDTVVSLQQPTCGNAFNSGLYDWSTLPGVKVNLGLYGIRSCNWLYEYDRFFRQSVKSYAGRIKSVVINLGTNDVIQLANNPSGSPKGEVKYIRQLIDALKFDLPNTQFIVTTISPCLNAACGSGFERELRVQEYNAELATQLQGYAGNRTVVVSPGLQEADLTIDKIHYNACAYQKTANTLRPWFSYVVKNTWPVSLPNCPLAPSTVHPCSFIEKK